MRRADTSGSAETLRIRLARPDEREALEELQRRASMALPDYRDQLAANPDAIDLPLEQVINGQVLVALIGERVAGFAAVVEGELDGVFVEPDLWRQGIGTALVEVAIRSARSAGLTVSVTASPAARDFYRSCGFSVEGEVQTRFGPALRMSRQEVARWSRLR